LRFLVKKEDNYLPMMSLTNFTAWRIQCSNGSFSMTDEIPQSNALAEAGSDSLDELLNRDPEGYSKLDRQRVIAGYREYRAKLERAGLAALADAAAKPKRVSKRKSATPVAVPAPEVPS
jgi:hypothetical protein